MLKGLYLRAVKIYNEEGLKTLLLKTKKFSGRFIKNGFKIPRYQTDERVDTEERWEILQDHIDADDENLVDIGCADGYLTSKFHEEGLFCIGIDRAEQMLTYARSGNEYADGICFMRYDVTPNSISKLPHFDITLLLTVYHHWVSSYGLEKAEEMLINISKNTNKLFFQPPGREIHANVSKSPDESIEEYYTNYLREILPKDADIQYLDTTDYTGGERNDPLYLISRDF